MLPTIEALLRTPEGLLGAVLGIGIVLERLTAPKKKKAYRRNRR